MGKLHVHCVGQRPQSTKGNYVGMEQECLILTDSARYVESLYIKITKYVKSTTTIWFIYRKHKKQERTILRIVVIVKRRLRKWKT